MAHDPSLAYADYFAAGGGAGAGEDDDHHNLYGGAGVVDTFGARAHFGLAADHPQLQQHYHHQQRQQAPLSLSLHGPAEAAAASSSSLVLTHHHHQQQQLAHQAWPQHDGAAPWHLRDSRFLLPTRQLLQEFCSLPVDDPAASSRPPTTTKPAAEDGSSSPAPPAQIQAMDAADLQRLKAKLYTMLDEVDRRYRRYREQMRAVAGSFEAVAGERAAAGYTRLASRTISRHFRTLRDGVAAQLQAVRKVLGEKDAGAGGVSPAGGAAVKGETTPRLRVLDQCMRQHRAYQAGVLETQPWRPQRGLPERAVSVLRAWLFEHFLHPYPSDVDKHILARQTGLSRSQVSNWFINARVRLWKPMVEEMCNEEMKMEDGDDKDGSSSSYPNPNPSSSCASDQVAGRQGRAGGEDGERKPTRAQLVVHDSGSLASVVSIGGRDTQGLGFGMMDGHIDFGSYGDHGFGGGGGVSLTLGLQQHADDPHGGVNVAFAPAGPPLASSHHAAAEFLFMAGGEQHQNQMVVPGGGVHHGQFGAGIQGDAAAAHYHRSLAGAATGFQLLHDLAG